MATRATPIIVCNDTNAHYQAWIQEVHAAIQAMGWVQTTDTGQLNPATIAVPSAPGVMNGYLVYRMNDALQATAPIFLRIDFGAPAGAGDTAAMPCMQITVGNFTNGAGTVGGAGHVNNGSFFIGSRVANNLASSIWTSGSTNRLAMCLLPDTGAAGYMAAFSIERTKDGNGVDTNAGVIVMTKAARFYATGGGNWGSDLCAYQAVLTGPGFVQADTAGVSYHDGAPCFYPGTAVNQGAVAVGANIPVMPWCIPSSRGRENDPIGFLSYIASLIPGPAAEFDVSLFGAAHHFRGIDSPCGATLFYGSSANPPVLALQTGKLAMRWE